MIGANDHCPELRSAMRHRHHFKVRFPLVEVEGAGLGILAALLVTCLLVAWLLFALFK